MKRRVFVVVLCLLFTLGICSVALAKGGNGGASGSKSGGNSGGNSSSQSSVTSSSSSGSVDSAAGECTEGQTQEGVENSGDTDQPVKNQLKTQDKIQEKIQDKTQDKIQDKIQDRIQVRETLQSGEGVETEAGDGPKVRVKGKDIKFDIPPVIKEGRTLIPVRAIMNGLGAEVAWDEAAKTVTIVRDGVTVVVTLDSRVITVNGEEQTIDVPAELINNRTFVPIRFVAQALNMNVDWDEDTGTVDIGDGTDTTTDDTTTDETATDETTTDETTTDGTTTDDTTGTDEVADTGTTTGDSTDTTTDTTTDETGTTDTTQQ